MQSQYKKNYLCSLPSTPLLRPCQLPLPLPKLCLDQSPLSPPNLPNVSFLSFFTVNLNKNEKSQPYYSMKTLEAAALLQNKML